MKRPGLLCAVALLVLSIWEIATLLRVHAGAATDADWSRARAAVEAGRQPGDLIVFAPSWVDPVGRQWLGDFMTIDDAARMDAARYGRIWEISIRGAHAPEAVGTPAETQRFGAVTVRRFDRAAATVSWDLRGHAHLLEVDFTPRKCAPLHPPQKLDVGSVPLGTQLVVYAGVSDFRSRKENHATALLRVLVDGVEATHAEIGNDSGWHALPVATTTPGPHQVTFESSAAPGNQASLARLDLCVAAEARTP